MAATRSGVARRPSRSGSSPMASRSSWTAFLTRSMSTLMAGTLWTVTVWTGRTSLVRSLVAVDAPEVAVALGDVQPVAHDEVARDGEADVAQGDLDALLALLDEQGADIEALRLARVEVAAEIVERQAAVDDVLDDEDAAALELGVEVLDDADDAAGLGRAAVRAHGHEVDVDRQLDRPAQIAQEEHGALEDGDEERGLVYVVPGDLGAQLGDTGRQLLLVDEEGADVGLGPRRDGGSGGGCGGGDAHGVVPASRPIGHRRHRREVTGGA